MRLQSTSQNQAYRAIHHLAGMTLVEMMMASALVLLVLAAIISANLIGLKENSYMASKAGASNTSRIAVNQMLTDIRMAKGFIIGNVTVSTNSSSNTNMPVILSGISQVTSGTIQGTALRLYPVLLSANESVDYTKYIQYSYISGNSNGYAPSCAVLWRYVSTNNAYTMVASNLVNNPCFDSENYNGANLWSSTYKCIIHTTLQFSEFQFPLTKVGTNYIFDYYRIDCRATPHLPDGT